MTVPPNPGSDLANGRRAAVGELLASMPRWVKLFVVIALVFAIAFVAAFGV